MADEVVRNALDSRLDSGTHLTEQGFQDLLDSHVADVVFEPDVVTVEGERVRGRIEQVAELDDEYQGHISLYRVHIASDQSEAEKAATLVHEVLHTRDPLAQVLAKSGADLDQYKDYFAREELKVEAETQHFFAAHKNTAMTALNRYEHAQS
jgi:hypothetical protein